MSFLSALLSQQTPNLQTRKGLIVVGLQNDFILPTGKLPVKDAGFVDRIESLVPAFREHGDVVWVRSEFQQTRPVNGDDTPGDTVVAGGSLGNEPEVPSSDDVPKGKRYKVTSPSSVRRLDSPANTYESSASFDKPDIGENDDELFLSRTSRREPCCVKGSNGADFSDRIQNLIQRKDLQVTKSHYSAFGGTSLLMTLRSKLITDVYICGCMTNLSVYATAMDAARYGIEITLIEDCLGYRRYDRHQMALRQLSDLMSANLVKSARVLMQLHNPGLAEQSSEEEQEEDDDEEQEADSLPAHDDVLEVDSEDDDSEEEVSVPSVGLPRRLLDRRTERSFATLSSKYSRDAAERPRIATAQYAVPQSSESDSRHDYRRYGTAERGNEYVKVKFDTSSSDSRIITTSSESSKQRSSQPWLDIIPPDYNKSSSPITSQITSSQVALSKLFGASSSDLQKWEQSSRRLRVVQDMATNLAKSKPLFGDDKVEESAGSRILYDLLPDDAAETVFDELQSEVKWESMYHQTGQVPRLVCCQATIGDDGSMPLYRHPSDQTLPVHAWTPTVDRIKKAAEKVAGHQLNHALIQLYRDGNDFISEHSDKTLDIAPDTKIVNVSMGAQRTMRIRTKRGSARGGDTAETAAPPRTTYRVPLPHNSMITMSLPTNAEYLHAVNWDRRPACELVEAEKAFGGQRISLTFRHVGTFLSEDSTTIWGQGAVGKSKATARPVINADPIESQKLVNAFGAENGASSINWEEIYGKGSDVLHLK